MPIHLTPESNPVVQEGTLYVDSATGEFNVAGKTVPHIIPGVLYPAYVASGTSPKLLDGTTTHGTGTYNGVAVSTDYGTVQADGRKYYYTNIAGSKPIKDPRVGGHFGSQRHKFKSLQQLEQETATHGSEVLSIDGREWCRLSNGGGQVYADTGSHITFSLGFMEVTGYLSDFNLIISTHTVERGFKAKIDGTDLNSGNEITTWETSVSTPLGSRYVDSGSLANVANTTTLGIHTIRIEPNQHSDNMRMFGIELIAQDTTSTANRSKIQIPSQDVVSYGKKFTVSAEGSSGHHYDPFNGMSAGSNEATLNTFIDLDTSLGVDQWKGGTANYYRPFQGGRVVKWVDSSGIIKTSVTMMPPNADNIGQVTSNALGNTEIQAGTNNYTINFTNTGTATEYTTRYNEVAKTFNFREFGNGAANEGTGGANYADASMLSSVDDIAYVMDDGLTSLSGKAVGVTGGKDLIGDNDDGTSPYYVTFIGTGMSVTNTADTPRNVTWFQNLPYGTHVVKVDREGGTAPDIYIDGVAINDNSSVNYYGEMNEVTFYQPKKPPIPEDACVLADYMLMADYVKLTSRSTGTEISKGVRFISGSRDVLYDGTFTNNTILDTASLPAGMSGCVSNATVTAKLHFFGTDVNMSMENQGAAHTLTFPGTTANTKTGIDGPADKSDIYTLADSATLGVNEVIGTILNGGYHFNSFYVATPIHTSSHYQPFETPFLHELIGGDRNMEQTNLVCSPDGKTWDEVTRDVSYIGSTVLSTSTDTTLSADALISFDDWRGSASGNNAYRFNKYFAIAYDRMICLEDGEYLINRVYYSAMHNKIFVNDQSVAESDDGGVGAQNFMLSKAVHLNRGDYLGINGGNGPNNVYNYLDIIKLS